MHGAPTARAYTLIPVRCPPHPPFSLSLSFFLSLSFSLALSLCRRPWIVRGRAAAAAVRPSHRARQGQVNQQSRMVPASPRTSRRSWCLAACQRRVGPRVARRGAGAQRERATSRVREATAAQPALRTPTRCAVCWGSLACGYCGRPAARGQPGPMPWLLVSLVSLVSLPFSLCHFF